MKPTFAYSFETIWKIKAPVKDVWDTLYYQEDWPNWWKGLKEVRVIDAGGENRKGKKVHFVWKSVLPYMLTFDMVSKFVGEYYIMEALASGDLEGRGTWHFSQEGDITTIKYNWDVNSTKKWMNILAPVCKPLFTWNHNIVMRWGAKGLAKKLNAELISF